MISFDKEVPLALIVDDDAVTRLLIASTLTKAGMRVVQAGNGKEALQVFAASPPDIILLDLSMPVMDGFETCRRLRKLTDGATLPVLVLTGYDDVKSIERAFEAGATDFMSKTTNHAIVLNRVRFILKASRAFNDLERSRRSLTTAQRIARIGSWEWEAKTKRYHLSDELLRMYGIDADGFSGGYEDFMKNVPDDDLEQIRLAFRELLHHGKPYSLHHRIILPDGRVIYVHAQAEAEYDTSGRVKLIYGTTQDVTKRHLDEEGIRRLAYYDALTDLPNRRLLSDRVQQATTFAARAQTKVALLFIDLDNFKLINDSLGHSVGDGLLKAIANRLGECVRDTDTISRQGGDEFLIVLPNLPDGEGTLPVLTKIREHLLQPFSIDGHELTTTVSIGIAIYPDDGENFEDLLKKADMAMYRAKSAGRNAYRFFDEAMNVEAIEQLTVRSGLRRALEESQFELHYQPQIDLASGALIGAEALIRWNHPELGWMQPARFIAVAEEAGMIVPIGAWVINEVCRQAMVWQQAGLPRVPLAVNLSAVQFRSGDLGQTITSALKNSGLDPSLLELELTESILMHNTDKVLAMVKLLKSIGVRISIDDFGTGYSSLSYLKLFAVDKLKIDKSFIRNLASDADDATIVRAIIFMAHSLGLKTVAEGVEDQETVALLRNYRCDEAQGYYFARPMPAEALENYLHRFKAD